MSYILIMSLVNNEVRVTINLKKNSFIQHADIYGIIERIEMIQLKFPNKYLNNFNQKLIIISLDAVAPSSAF